MKIKKVLGDEEGREVKLDFVDFDDVGKDIHKNGFLQWKCHFNTLYKEKK